MMPDAERQTGRAPAGQGLALLRTEVAAARIEALTRAEPAVGRLWRTEAAFVEAVRSVALEDVALREADLVARLAVNPAPEVDARGAELALQVLAVLRRPGDVLSDPVAGIRRIEAAAAPVGAPPEPGAAPDDDALRAVTAGVETLAEMPVAAGLAAAAAYARASARASPAAERLVFVAVEDALRRRAAGPARGAASELGVPDPLGPVSASWVVAPATALTRRGFRLWSPLRPEGVDEFVRLAGESLAWDLGHLGRLRHEVARLRAAGQGRGGRSHMPALAELVLERPVFTSASVAAGLGVTRRTALTLIAELEAAGHVRSLVPRRAARIWATASLAGRLCLRAAPGVRAERRAAEALQAAPAAPDSGATDALAALDRAIGDADAVLRRLTGARAP